MLPSLLRGNSSSFNETLFNFNAHYLAVVLRHRLHDAFHDMESYLLWVRALAQHYGPGSHFLDVTHSVDVAVWFALHGTQPMTTQHVLGPPGPIDPSHDRVTKLDFLVFEEVASKQGVLYVFDVPVWQPGAHLEHGMLVDLALAPAVFKESSRMEAQSACLLHSDGNVDGGDLSSFVVSRLDVHRDVVDATRSSADLFPGPRNDPWYERLLSIPLVNRFNEASRLLELAQPIPVTLYLTDKASFVTICERLITLEPPTLWSSLQAELTDDDKQRLGGFDLSDAVPILLDLPVYAMSPPLDNTAMQWNVSIAVSQLPDTALVRDSQTSKVTSVAVNKVFIEFSPLELVNWNEVESAPHTMTFRRGALVEIGRNSFKLWVVDQQLPAAPRLIRGPILFARDKRRGLVCVAPDNKRRRLSVGRQPSESKRLLVVLMMLRELSGEVLPSPFPMFTADERISVFRAQGGGTTQLLKVPCSGGEHVYLLRDTASGLPFVPTTSAGIFIAGSTDEDS